MPQALAVPQKTGDAWIAMNDTDRVLRYLPACAHEDLVPAFICIEPEPSWAASSGETAATALALMTAKIAAINALQSCLVPRQKVVLNVSEMKSRSEMMALVPL
jgi:hypothetical protein